jgi:hypothetical protein
MVTATLIGGRKRRPPGSVTRGRVKAPTYRPDGAAGGAAVEDADIGSVGAVVLAAGADAFVGIFSFCPTVILSVFRLFAARSAFTVVPLSLAILLRLSPDLTV